MKLKDAMDKFEVLWYTNMENGDQMSLDFDTQEEALDYYNKHKNDPDKTGWWVTRRDPIDWSILEDIVY